jgi:xanthine dehydrogenase YagR molybdenum-binding subunit
MAIATRSTRRSRARIEGPAKVTGEARYAFEYHPEQATYAVIVPATIARGAIAGLDETGVRRIPGVLAVLWCGNAERLHEAPGELAVLQSRHVAYRGQIAAAVVAETLETARHAAELVRIEYQLETMEALLTAGHRGLYRPDRVNAGYETDTISGDVDAALEAAPVRVDATYETPAFHNNPMEPHATVAAWEPDGSLTLYDSTQGASGTAQTIAAAFGLEPADVRVVNAHVGGGFGSKGTPRPHVVLAAMAARAVGRPVKLAVTRQQMFPLTGYRTPTIQRVQLGAGADGRLTAIAHDVVEQTSTVVEFVEQTAVVTRMLYAAPNRRTTHRVAALDVPTPSWMRAPGECPGMYALESAIDELAVACGIDPVELRAANEPDVDPESGHPFSSRGLVACLREGARRFGWEERDPAPGVRRDGRWLVGTGAASSTYPARRRPSRARARREADGGFQVAVAANDIGTGARTVLQQIAADALDTDPERVRIEIGDSSLPFAPVAGGSMGTASWGSAVVKACRALLEHPDRREAEADTTPDIERDEPLARHAFGAQFVEVRVNTLTGEIRVPRMTGVFAAGAILNPATARSQLAGGMTMGLGMALLEESVLDPQLGAYVNHDLATYHVPTYADVGELDISWLEEEDPHLNPMGSKGIGEIGIVGTAAAVANAVHHATGHRFRRLPIGIADVLGALGRQA